MRKLTWVLVLLMTGALPLESAYQIPFGGSLTKLLAILAAASWLLSVYATGRLRQPQPAHVAALLFVMWSAASMLWTLDADASQTRVLTYAQLLGLTMVVWDTVTTRSALSRVLLAYVVGCFVGSASLVVAYVSQGADAVVHGRFTLGTFNPNDAGLILSIGLAIAVYLLDAPPFRGRRRVATRVFAAGYLLLGAFAIVGTGSRSAVLAALVALCYACFVLGRRGLRFLVGGFATLALGAVATLPLLPPRALVRLLATGSEIGEGNLNDRQQVWPEALRLIQENPGLGVGSGAFRTAAVGVNKTGHNFALTLLAELGPVGLVLFVAMLALAVRAALRAPHGLPALWITVSCAWMSAALLHNWEQRKVTWVLLSLMVVSGALRPERRGDARLPGRAPAVRVGGVRTVPDASPGARPLNQPVAAARGPT